jgi:ribosomal protein S18 acetylase RimI-like enzyme
LQFLRPSAFELRRANYVEPDEQRPPSVLVAGNSSYGFVDEATPELGIAVAAGLRGHGIGRSLLRALIEAAARDAHPGISLSVAPANPSRR